jgi:curved DNA-binding protein CbpA
MTLQIDPAEVLGVAADATLEQIRDAYRAKAKRHHPDVGGEEWAFRIIAQAYETMSTARVVRASAREAEAPPRAARRPGSSPFANANGDSTEQVRERFRAQAQAHASRASAGSAGAGPGRPFGDANESVRRGVQEKGVDPAHVVDVEKLSIRYQSEGIWLITERSNEDRFLSCCLNVSWPSPGQTLSDASAESTERILRELGLAFDAVDVHSKATSSSASVAGNRFSGWLSYPSSNEASAAFTELRQKLHGIGLAVNQWSRDLVIPRQWR